MTSITPENTAILLVVGAWHAPHHYSDLTDGLKQAGYTVVAPALPSVGREDDAFADDVAALRSGLHDIFKSGKDAAILMHSYGGVPGGEAAKGLVKGEGDNENGVVKLVYMSAFALPTGVSLDDALARGPPLTWMVRTPSGKGVNAERNDEIFYNDIDDAGWRKKTSGELKVHSTETMATKTTWEPYRTVSAAYLLCEKDAAIPVQAQEGMAQGAGIEQLARIDASHTPWKSKTKETVQAVLDALAGKL